MKQVMQDIEPELLDRAIKMSLDGIVIGELTGKITYVNDSILKMFAVPNQSYVIGKHVLDFIADKDKRKAFDNSMECLIANQGRKEQYTVVAFDGREVQAEITIALIKDEKGTNIGFVDVVRDLTSQVLVQDSLRLRSEELEALVDKRTKELQEAQSRLIKAERFSAIGELAGMVGHDLRNPLTSIKNATFYLKRKLGQTANAKELEMLDIIEKSANYSNKIITDLLDYSREITLEIEETTPKALVDYVLLLFPFPKHIIVKDRTSNEPQIWVDVNKLERVFTNIMKNAIDAMPEKGVFEISSQQVGDNVEFIFTDTGIGMSEQTLAKIFLPLFTTKAQGMGFGLAICKRIVEAHGGEIQAKSETGKGTTFTITMPIEKSSPKVQTK